MKKVINSIFNRSNILLLVLVIVFFPVHYINAASLSILPNNSKVSLGNIVSVKVSVNTNGSLINNTESTIQFPVDMLEVLSISKSSSIFSLWVEEPNFSNYTGKISFNGGLPSPGFSGNDGNVISITFRAKKSGTASLIFTNASVRANDGLGTDILNSKNSGVINIEPTKEIIVKENISEKINNIPKPVIISETHPNQDLWYLNNTASFIWKIPTGITSIKTLLDNKSSSNPTIVYDNSVSGKTLNNLPEGISYLHLQFLNGIKSSIVSHYKIQIDTEPPIFENPILREDGKDNFVKLVTTDKTSGVNYYELTIDDNTKIVIHKNELNNDEYLLPLLNNGKHKLNFKVYDKAGNTAVRELYLVSDEITVPEISLSTQKITKGDTVTIFGKTDYPNTSVNIFLESNNVILKQYSQITTADGSFSILTDKIKDTGSIAISAETVFSDLLKSRQSKKVYLEVDEIKIIKFTLLSIYAVLGVIVVSIFLLILLFVLYLGWHKFFGLKNKINNELKNTRKDIHKSITILKDELNNQLYRLEKEKLDRDLNKKEEKIFTEIKNNVDDIDRFIQEKLKDVI